MVSVSVRVRVMVRNRVEGYLEKAEFDAAVGAYVREGQLV